MVRVSELDTMDHPGEIVVYLVGDDLADTRNWDPYDSRIEAQAFCDMDDTLKVFKTVAYVDYDSAEEVS